jgi:hypothetical protein
LINKAEKTGLVINVKKMKALRRNTSKIDTFTIRGESIEDVIVLCTWAVWLLKMEELCRMSHNKFEKQMVLLYNSIQCGRTAEYLLGPNSASSVVM